ncbi:hypothetical protein C8Q78DRAFT_1045232 [Trametes maxima]|nr:hypothetical protein C8Q78DRAFT_1045232 [Trametes maxima]
MQDLYELDPAEEAEPQLSRRRHLVPQEEPFAFDWQLVSSSASVPDSGDVSRIRGRLQALHTDSNLSNETLKLRDAAVSLTIDITVPDEDVLDVLDIASAEFGTLPDGVSGTSAKIGRLRRYSSLNFELESSTSGTSLQPGLDDSARELAPSPFRLRHARSILGLSLGNTEEDLSSVSWASKLRRRTRPEADSPAVDLQPEPELPKGVKRIGDGIGYTRRADVRRSVLSLGSLTPRTCQGLFKLGGKRKQKKGTPGASDGDAQRERVDAPADELYEDDGDPMDEVMREIYGDDWAAGTSPPADVGPASVRVCERGGGRVGLGWDSGPLRGYGMSPVDASFAGADSTLRLVSPSTPRLGLLDV